MAERSSQPSSGVLAQIDTRLACFTAGDLIAPSNAPPPTGENFVGILNDHQRRLCTLGAKLTDETNVLVRENRGLRRQIAAATKPTGNPFDVVRRLIAGALPAHVVDRHEVLNAQIELQKELIQLVHDLLWLDIRMAFPALAGKAGISIYSDWSVGWTDDTGLDGFEIIGLEDVAMPKEVREAIKGALGDIFGHGGRSRQRVDA